MAITQQIENLKNATLKKIGGAKKRGVKPDNSSGEIYIHIGYQSQSDIPIDNYFRITSGSGEDDYEAVPVRISDIPSKSRVYRATTSTGPGRKDVVLRESKSKSAKMTMKERMQAAVRGNFVATKGVNKNDRYVTQKGQEVEDRERDIRAAPITILVDRFIEKSGQESGKTAIITLLIREDEAQRLTLVSWVKTSQGIYNERNFVVDVVTDFSEGESLRDQIVDTVSTSLSGEGFELPTDESQIDNIFIFESQLVGLQGRGWKKDTYPVPEEVAFIPKSYFGASILVASGVTFFIGASISGYTTLRVNNINERAEQIIAMQPDVRAVERDLIATHVEHYINGQSINYKAGLRASEQVYLPTTSVSLTQDDQVARIIVSTGTNSTGSDSEFNPHEIAIMMSRQKAPSGFEKEPVEASGSFLSYQVSYVGRPPYGEQQGDDQ